MKYPCYTTKTGLKIGCRYEKPIRQLTHDEVLLQSVLLGSPRRTLSVKFVALACLFIWFAIIWINI